MNRGKLRFNYRPGLHGVDYFKAGVAFEHHAQNSAVFNTNIPFLAFCAYQVVRMNITGTGSINYEVLFDYDAAMVKTFG